MQVRFFCPRWGQEHLNWREFSLKAMSAGYHGIEYAIPGSVSPKELDEAFNAASRYDLAVIAQHYDTAEININAHLETYHRWFERLTDYPVLRINSQTGKDYFSFAQNQLLIDSAYNFAKRLNKPISHETHRGKFSFAAHLTSGYLKEIPHLQLTLDLSHWCCVAESLLEDQPETIEQAVCRTQHLHARVGFSQGPQVSDPFQPEWKNTLSRHLHIWDRVLEQRKKAGDPIFSITPESGPYPYMAEAPGTRRPLADQWVINERMMNHLHARYA